MTLKKDEFARLMAEKTGRTIRDSREVIEDFLETFADAIRNEQPVKFYGYLTLNFKEMAQRDVKVPLSGDTVTVPAHTRPVIKVAEILYKESGD